MLLYTDVISGDELISDAYDMKLVDDVIYEVDCQMIVVQEGNIDIGANPSAEEQEEALENGATQVNNVVNSFRLTNTAYDKKQYLSHLKGYMKAIEAKLQETNPERVPIFKSKAQEVAKKLIGSFKDLEFLIGESMNPDAMVCLLNYREDGTTPYIMFWKDGLKEVKL